MTTQIVDAHHHIWRTGWTPWLSGPMTPRIFGPYHALRRDYLAAEYAADARPSGVTRSVHIQANVAPGKAVDEVAWATSSGRQAGLVQAGTFTRRCRLDEWQPVIETAIDLFGPGRCMFGSNFPIEKLWTDYATLTSVFRASLSRYTPGEQQQVLHDVAARTYQPCTSQPVLATRDRSKRHQ